MKIVRIFVMSHLRISQFQPIRKHKWGAREWHYAFSLIEGATPFGLNLVCVMLPNAGTGALVFAKEFYPKH